MSKFADLWKALWLEIKNQVSKLNAQRGLYEFMKLYDLSEKAYQTQSDDDFTDFMLKPIK